MKMFEEIDNTYNLISYIIINLQNINLEKGVFEFFGSKSEIGEHSGNYLFK